MNYDKMIKELIDINQLTIEIPKDDQAKAQLLRFLMTISIPWNLSEGYYEEEAKYLALEKEKKSIVAMADITEKLMDKIYLYKGDITTIAADAIVNAANSKLLGCFIPGHHCIDNAIHLAAGLHLRNACHELMVMQGHDEAVGQAKITGAYHLPSKYVVHTVGPNMNGPVAIIVDEMKPLLRSCYHSILNLVESHQDIKNIVFCSISTGVFGVDIGLASEIALKAIQAYLSKDTHHLEKIVINVFNQEDYNVYKETANKIVVGAGAGLSATDF